ncbi:MAG: hypothetical protein HW401_356 [Parcubacteria group bacterium]|nr:hypothetical protein [Parcubacteria group bacterium]
MNDQLYKNLKDILSNKTESEVKEYVIKHFSEFPENMQGDIARDFFEEGLLKVAEKNQAISDLQEKGLTIAGGLIEEKKLLDNKLKYPI